MLSLLYGPALSSIHDHQKDHSFDSTDYTAGKVMSLLFNMLSRLLIAFLPSSKHILISVYLMDFPDGSDGKASAYLAEDPGLIPGLGRSSGEGNGNPLQYSCLENPMNRGAWRATVHEVTNSLPHTGSQNNFPQTKGLLI